MGGDLSAAELNRSFCSLVNKRNEACLKAEKRSLFRKREQVAIFQVGPMAGRKARVTGGG